MYLSEFTKGRNNNLNILRFIAAVCVIVSHSIPLSRGGDYADGLSVYTGGRLSLGGVAVGLFFVTGGYLIAKSAETKKNFKNYFTARCIRIFPELIFVTVILALLAGPVFSVLTPSNYYKDMGTWKYLLNCIFVLQHNLPGVFVENIYGATVNGPLWTLPVEFMCYIMCFCAYKLKFFSQKKFKYTIPLAVLAGIISTCFFNTFMIAVIRPVLLFYIGMGMYVYRNKIVLEQKMGILSIILFIISILLKADIIAMYFFFPYMVYYIAFGIKYKYDSFGQKWEISYGMYLWGWPVGQTLCMLFGGQMNWVVNMILTLFIAIGLGGVNDYVVNRRIKKYTERVRKKH